MAVPDYFKVEPGTPITWKAASGTYGITCTNLANGSAREGAKGDLGTNFARRWKVTIEAKLAVAGTNGNEIELYASQSDSATAGTGNAGNTTGADAALANSAETKLQMIPVGSLAVSNALGTGTQRQHFEFIPIARYFIPVVVNNSGQAFSATAGDTIITLTPLEELVQDLVA